MNSPASQIPSGVLSSFSKVTATATHDLKNHIAIINENAGLLEDLAMMAESGPPLAPDRVAGISRRIKKQVDRADRVLRHLNRFAHGADQDQKGADLEKSMGLVLDLAERLVKVRGAKVDMAPPSGPVWVDTRPCLVEHILFQALMGACEAVAGTKEISVRIEHHPPGVRFHLSQVSEPLPTAAQGELAEKAADLNLKFASIEKNSFALFWAEPSL